MQGIVGQAYKWAYGGTVALMGATTAEALWPTI